MDDKLYIYLEYVAGGSIHKLLREYGQLGESAIRSYTQQILSGLAYLHAKSTVHRFVLLYIIKVQIDSKKEPKLIAFTFICLFADSCSPFPYNVCFAETLREPIYLWIQVAGSNWPILAWQSM